VDEDDEQALLHALFDIRRMVAEIHEAVFGDEDEDGVNDDV
jgi:hypothetical protein